MHYLVLVPTLGDEFITDFDPRFQQVLVQILSVDAQQLRYAVAFLSAIGFGLFFSTSLLEFHSTHVHYGGSNFVDVILLLLGETQDVEGLL